MIRTDISFQIIYIYKILRYYLGLCVFSAIDNGGRCYSAGAETLKGTESAVAKSLQIPVLPSIIGLNKT